MSADLQQETTQLLQRLIRCNTVNPPGNERVLQEGLAADLREAGFEVDLLGSIETTPEALRARCHQVGGRRVHACLRGAGLEPAQT